MPAAADVGIRKRRGAEVDLIVNPNAVERQHGTLAQRAVPSTTDLNAQAALRRELRVGDVDRAELGVEWPAIEELVERGHSERGAEAGVEAAARAHAPA